MMPTAPPGMSQRVMSAEIATSTFAMPGTAVPLIGIAGVSGAMGAVGVSLPEPHAVRATSARPARIRMGLRRRGMLRGEKAPDDVLAREQCALGLLRVSARAGSAW